MTDLTAAANEILEAAKALPEGAVIAVDGRCASGKSSLALKLRELSGCTVIHADDFFLPPEMRTNERLSTPGGNLHRERLINEVLIPISEGRRFSYRPFDCSTGGFGSPVFCERSGLYVVEGSYSCHPEMRLFYGLTVFVSTDGETQLSRISSRDGEGKLAAFQSRWIPLEEEYFKAFDPEKLCDLVFYT